MEKILLIVHNVSVKYKNWKSETNLFFPLLRKMHSFCVGPKTTMNCLKQTFFSFFHFINRKTERDHHKISKKQMIHKKCITPNAINYFGSLFRLRIFSLYWRRKKRCFRASFFKCYLLLCTENEIRIRMDECVPFATL